MTVSTWQAGISVWLLFLPTVMPKIFATALGSGTAGNPVPGVNQKEFFFTTESPHGGTFATGLQRKVFLGTRHRPLRSRMKKHGHISWDALAGSIDGDNIPSARRNSVTNPPHSVHRQSEENRWCSYLSRSDVHGFRLPNAYLVTFK